MRVYEGKYKDVWRCMKVHEGDNHLGENSEIEREEPNRTVTVTSKKLFKICIKILFSIFGN